MRTSDAPIVATHSNAHALCASSRNLTDEQLDAVARSGGVVGVNFAASFLREDGRNDAATALGEIVRHVEYLTARMGVDHVAFGSDFEGAVVPDELGGVAGLPRLVEALARAPATTASRSTGSRTATGCACSTRRGARGAATFASRPTTRARRCSTPLERFAAPGLAVDLGAGTGRDTAELLRRGWERGRDRPRAGGDRAAAPSGGARLGAPADARRAASSRPSGPTATW